MDTPVSFYKRFCLSYHRNILASFAWKFFVLLALVGVYAPLFASSKPILVRWQGEFFSPLLRYLWFPGFYTKPIDLFFNVLMVTLPLFWLAVKFLSGWGRRVIVITLTAAQIFGFLFVYYGKVQDPKIDEKLKKLRIQCLLQSKPS
ncbi:binding--dependent transport system inner membrane component family protein, partial [Chlamydia ibidis]